MAKAFCICRIFTVAVLPLFFSVFVCVLVVLALVVIVVVFFFDIAVDVVVVVATVSVLFYCFNENSGNV